MNEILKRLRMPAFSWKRNDVISFLFWFISVLIWEIAGHFICYNSFPPSSLYIIPFSALFALILTFLTRLCSEKWNRRWTAIITFLLFFFYCTQIVYHRVFGTFYSVKMIKVGGTAMKKFWKETFYAILYSWWQILLLTVPIVLGVIRKRRFPASYSKRQRDFSIILFGIVILAWLACVTSLRIGGTKRHTAYGAYHSDTIVTSESVNKLGLITAMRLEITQLLFPSDTDVSDYQLIVTRLPKVAGAQESEYPIQQKSKKNQVNIDFEELDTFSYDERVQALNKYFSYVKPTSQNEYTGYFKGKNLIEFCAESYSPVCVSEELTPTLYMLSHNGFVFTNYYTSFENTTTNCEYAFCMGLMPDLTRNKWDASFIPSANNALPYCVGNAFRNLTSLNYHTYFFHNNVGTFYERNVTHPNMGFDCYFEKENYDDPEEVGMTFTTDGEPTSDLEMIQQSLPIILKTGEPFVAYYMTYSGHYDYDFELNPMCEKNRDIVEEYVKKNNLPYTEKEKAYLSCNLELEYALQYLLEELGKRQMLDDTVIVLTCDHYPYGLSHEEYRELAGEDLSEPFGRMKNNFILWSGAMEEPVVCDNYCCNIDILPTVLNLFGINYDSRLLAGVDVLSDGPHIAFLTDESFISDVMMFNSTENTYTYFVDEELVPSNYYDSAIQLIQDKMNMSSLILYTNYYQLVFNPTNYESPKEGVQKGISLGYWIFAGLLIIFVITRIIKHQLKKKRLLEMQGEDASNEDAVDHTDSETDQAIKQDKQPEEETIQS